MPVFVGNGGWSMIEALLDLLGTSYQDGDLPRAERLALGILEAVPDDAVSRLFLGLIYYRSQRREAAIQTFDATARYLLDRGDGVHHDGRLSAAAHCLRAARAQGSPLAVAWYDLGLVLLRLRRYQQAIDALESALSARPDWRAAQRAIGRVGLRSCRRDPASAKRCTQAAVRGHAGHCRAVGHACASAETDTVCSGERRTLGHSQFPGLPAESVTQGAAYTVCSDVDRPDVGKRKVALRGRHG